MGILFLFSLVFADPNPPDLLWRIDFRNGSKFTLRVCVDNPDVRHQVTSSYVRELLARASVVRPIRQTLAELVERPSAPPDRSALIRLPVRGDRTQTSNWIVEGLIEGLHPIVESSTAVDVHLTLVVGLGFPYAELEKAIGNDGFRSMIVFASRTNLFGPRSPRERNWEGMPAVENVIPLLPAPAEPGVEDPIPITEEIDRLEAEWKERTAIFEEEREMPSEKEQRAMMRAARSLSAEGQQELRKVISEQRANIANRLRIESDPLAAVMSAIGRIRNACSAKLEGSA